MRNGLLKILLILMLLPGGALAETVYVDDQLRLGVRAAPDAAEKSIAVVKTGDALEVLGEQDSFINIRTESGLEGWVSKGYVSSEAPARSRLEAAQRELETLKKKQAPLVRQLGDSAKEVTQLEAQLAQLKAENDRLQEQLGMSEKSEAQEPPAVHPALIGLLLLGGFLAGLVTGVRWKARRVAERIGGLEI